jgi:8-oxo-dGTP diphosphatase
MGKIERVELTNMCMICDGTRVLVQDRKNPNWPGVIFPGGHVEPGESFVDSVVREIKEETGLTISNVQLCGIKQYVPKTDENYDRYMVLLYKTETFSGELKGSEEGNVFWIERADLLSYPHPHGFESMAEVFLNDQLSENYWAHQNNELFWKNK